MDIKYRSTRSKDELVTASRAILNGLAENGGLYIPERVPALDIDLNKLPDMDYRETAYAVMSKFLTDFTPEELHYCIDNAYDSKFDTPDIAPLVKVGDAYGIELFHGKTIAFKDMALSILPYLLTTAAKKNNITNEIVILTATSGDTGKAALAGFADVPGTRIIVFYPKDGVSPIQEKQMVTQKGDNTFVIGIKGNFDQAQTGVKEMFNNAELKARMNASGFQFSSANSINIGRLVPQVVYYVYAYGQMIKKGAIKAGDTINIVVPTGNFGNILAAYFAKQMGLPVDRLVCASNENKVLFDFFTTGEYDRNREFILTSSPSMDILISSNLERLIFLSCDMDTDKNNALMEELNKTGRYSITPAMKEKIKDFYGNYASEKETKEIIHKIFEKEHYLSDPHSAVAYCVYEKFKKDTGDTKKAVVASTASPYKFTRSVMSAVDPKYDSMSDFDLVDEMNRITGVSVPEAIEEIRKAPVLHKTVCEVSEMQKEVEKFLGL